MTNHNLRELLAKYFKNYPGYEGETDQTIEAIRDLILSCAPEKIQDNTELLGVEDKYAKAFNKAIDQFISNIEERLNG